MAGIIRITGGSARGRRIDSVAGRDVRPTSARVREAVFSILGDVTGLSILDLYAGVGTLGLEALSRGAAHVDFVERSRRHGERIHGNLEALGFAGRSAVWVRDAGAFITRPPTGAGGPYDLIFLDPPYGGGEPQRILPGLFRTDILSPTGRVVMEHEARTGPPPDSRWRTGRTYRYGKSCITLLSYPTGGTGTT